MDKDFITSLAAIFDDDPDDGIQKMKYALTMNTFKDFSQFKNFYNKNNQCHHFWLQPKFCIELNESKHTYLQTPQPICFNCFTNSEMYLNYEQGTISAFDKNIKIRLNPFGKCKCGEPNNTNSFNCNEHVQHESNSDFPKETVKNVAIAVFTKINTLVKKKDYDLSKVINFLIELAEINDNFLREVSEAILSVKEEIQQIIQNSGHFSSTTNMQFCRLFLFLTFEPLFLNEFLHILLDNSLFFSTECFKNVSRKIIGDRVVANAIWIELFSFTPDFSIQFIKEKNFESFEFAKNFILHFQKEMINSKFENLSCFPYFYKSILKIYQTQIEYISREGDDEMKTWIQAFFENTFESLNALESNFDTKFMEYTEENAYYKLIYLYEWTYYITKVFISKDESQYQVNIDFNGLSDFVFCALDYNFISENLFDNDNANEEEEEEEGKKNEDKKEEEEEEETEGSALKKSIRSEKAKVSLFNQLITFYAFYLMSISSPVIDLKDLVDQTILLYGSIIPVRLLCWNFSYKMNLGSTLNGGGDNFFKEFNNDEKRKKLLYTGNFGFIQIAALLLEDEQKEDLVNLIASSFGIYEKSTKDNNLNEYLPTLKLCFIFFIGCLYFDRYTSLNGKIGDNERKESIRMIQMIHRLKKDNVHLDELNRKEFETIQKVANKRKTTNDRSIFCLKSKEELPIYWNPFYVINPINEVISLLAKEIPSKKLLLLPSVEDELNGRCATGDDPRLEGLEFHRILMTPTVYSLIYSIISDFFIENQKNIESLHLSLNLLLIIVSKIQPNEANKSESETFNADNLRQLTLLATCDFEDFVVKKINFIQRGEHSLFDLLLKLKEFGEPVIKELKKKIPSLNKVVSTEDDTKKKKSNRAHELKRTISESFQNQIDLFKSSSIHTELDEEEEEDTNDICQICQMSNENQGLCYMIYIYETSLPSLFEPRKDGKPRKVFQFSICNHLFHRNCAFKETGVPPENDEFTCPIDRITKNAIMPKIDGYKELDPTSNYEVSVFLVTLKIPEKVPFEKLVSSFASIFVLNEVRFRLGAIQDHIKYSSQILLARNLYFILWHAIRELDMKIDKDGMTLFQRFVSAILNSTFHDDIRKYRRLVHNYSNRIEGIDKCLFLRRCRVFEFFIYETKDKNIYDQNTRLDVNELTNQKLCEHFGIDDDEYDTNYEYSFACNHFKTNLPFNYIDLCEAYDEVFNARKVSAMNLIDGSVVRERWATTAKLLLDFILDEDYDQDERIRRILRGYPGNFMPNGNGDILSILNSLNSRNRDNDDDDDDIDLEGLDDDYSSEDSEIFMLLVESEFEEQETTQNAETQTEESNSNDTSNDNSNANNATANNTSNNANSTINNNDNSNSNDNSNTNNNNSNANDNDNSAINNNNDDDGIVIDFEGLDDDHSSKDSKISNDNSAINNNNNNNSAISNNDNSNDNSAISNNNNSNDNAAINNNENSNENNNVNSNAASTNENQSTSNNSNMQTVSNIRRKAIKRPQSTIRKVGKTPIMLMMIGNANSMVIILYQKKYVELKPFYVDADGEPDVGFKREGMLFFSEENYEIGFDSLLSGDFTLGLKTIYS